MSEASATQRRWRWLVLALLVVAADQASKAWIVHRFGEFEVLALFPVLDITLMHNVGAAFSFLAGASGWQRWFFIGLSTAVSLAIVVWLLRMPPGRKILSLGLALVLGGAIGNAVDRIRIGSVVDFIHFHWAQAYFPAFNVADSAITVGAGCLLLDALLDSRRKG